MTASTAQISANRANALHSTGPRTEPGKVVSSANARTHGYTAARFAVRPEEDGEFQEYLGALGAEIQPCGALEQHQFTILVQAGWNLHRLRGHEFDLLGAAENPFLDERLSKSLDRLVRYKRALERTYKDALAALRTLQTNRAQHEAHNAGNTGDLEPDALPPLADVASVTKRSQFDPMLDAVRRSILAIDTEAHAYSAAARIRDAADIAQSSRGGA